MYLRRKGQMFTIDLVASVVVFFVIVNIALLAWNNAYSNRTLLRENKDMRNRVVRVTDILVRSPGHPEDWNSSNVEIIGFVKENKDHILDRSKLQEFANMEYVNQKGNIRSNRNEFYLTVNVDGEIAKVKTSGSGIGEDPVAYIPREDASIDSLKLLDVLNGSDVTWDLYWPSNSDQDKLPGLTARNVYNHTDQVATSFDDMLSNASDGSYSTIISEEANLSAEDINNEDSLDSFVRDSGKTYIHMGDKPELIREVFDLEETGRTVDPSNSSSWSMFGRHLNHSRFSLLTTPANISDGSVTSVSSFSAGDEVDSSPAIARGHVYVGSDGNKIYQLNASDISQKIAEFETGGKVVSSPAVKAGYVYVGSYDKKVYQLDASDISQKIAEYTTGGYVTSSPAVTDESVYVGSYDDNVYQLNASDISQKIAEYSTGGDVDSSPSVASGVEKGLTYRYGYGYASSSTYNSGSDYVYVGSDEDNVYQLNASDISQKIAEYSTGGDVDSSPSVDNASGFVYVGSDDDTVYQLNLSDISQKLHEFTTGDNVTSSPAIASDYVYIGSDDSSVYKLNASDISQKENEFTTGGDVDSSPAVTDQYVFVGGDDSEIYQLNSSNISQKISSYNLGGDVDSSPAIANGSIYVGSDGGSLYRFAKKVGVIASNGTVNQTSLLLNSSLEEGDNVSFEEPHMMFENVTELFIKSHDRGGCLACEWERDNGSVFYLADSSSSTGGNLGITEPGSALSENLLLEFGKKYSSADTVATHNRRVLVNTTNKGISIGELNLVFWDE